MKLKIYNQKTLPVVSTKTGQPSIHVARSGVFTINCFAVTMLGLNDVARLQFAQDEDEPQDWYVWKSMDSEGYAVRLKSKKGDEKNMIFSNAALANLILNSLGVEKSVRLPLASQPEEIEKKQLFALLTKAIAKAQLKAA